MDQILELVLPELGKLLIRQDHIKAVYFTKVQGHVKDILELYDVVNCKEDYRHVALHEIVDEMDKECKKNCKNNIIELSDKLETTEIPFMPNLFNEEEFNNLIEMLTL